VLNLTTLNQLNSNVTLPAYDPRTLPISVVHFGPGAFHRAHQAAFFDALNAFDPRWGICGVSLHSAGVRDALVPQDGLYALAVLDEVVTYRVIGSMREVLVANDDQEAVFTRLADPQVQLVTSTVTEKGYCLKADTTLDFDHADVAHDLAHPHTPKSFIGYVVEGLHRRYQAQQKPFILIPCDNLPDNGKRLKAAVIAFAAQVYDAAFADWIAANVQAPCTMVDSITPATDDALRSRVADAIGATDAWPIQREAFAQWVIEKHEHENAPDWARVGVTLTDNVTAFEKAKLRLLNGPHSTLAYWGSIKGYTSVSEAIADPGLADFLRAYMTEDIVPLLYAADPEGFAGVDLTAYSAAILARFRNPEIKHLLAQIAFDGSVKLPIRILSPIKEAIAAGKPVTRFATPIAAWLRFIQMKVVKGETINDPLSSELATLGAQFDGSAADVDLVLRLRAVFSEEVATNSAFVAALKAAYLTLG
jgi:fructuronate reductase